MEKSELAVQKNKRERREIDKHERYWNSSTMGLDVHKRNKKVRNKHIYFRRRKIGAIKPESLDGYYVGNTYVFYRHSSNDKTPFFGDLFFLNETRMATR
jgi:hypothetical protein